MQLQRDKKNPVARQRSIGPQQFQNTKKRAEQWKQGAHTLHGTVLKKMTRKERIKDRTKVGERGRAKKKIKRILII